MKRRSMKRRSWLGMGRRYILNGRVFLLLSWDVKGRVLRIVWKDNGQHEDIQEDDAAAAVDSH